MDAENLFNGLKSKGYSVTDLTENEAAKVHLRHMVGGKPKSQYPRRFFVSNSPREKELS